MQKLATGELPYLIVAGAFEPGAFDLLRVGEDVRKHRAKAITEILVEEQFHAGAETIRRSRSAA
jgi:hypothetical protein